MVNYKNCQSCGMPFKRDPEGGGSNADGSRNHTYCSKCYTAGHFNNPEVDSATKMQAFVKERIKDMGYPGIIAGLFASRISSLERWKSKK